MRLPRRREQWRTARPRGRLFLSGCAGFLSRPGSRHLMLLLLPEELFRPIFRNLKNRELCSIARTCRTTQVEAESLIYRNIALNSPRFIVEFCRLVCKTPRLRPHIRILYLNLGLPNSWVTNECRALSGYSRLISSALGHMMSLRDLTIWFNIHFATAGVLERCAFKLFTFKAVLPVGNGTLSRFLSRQDELRTLIILPHAPMLSGWRIKPQFLPKLAELWASTEDVSVLINGRPINNLSITDVNPSLITNLGLSAVPIQRLRLSQSLTIVNMRSLWRVLPDLKALYFCKEIPTIDSVVSSVVHYLWRLWHSKLNLFISRLRLLHRYPFSETCKSFP
jgi:hypothetical protein